MARKTDLLQGTLDLLILRTLAAGPMHGWAISQRIQQVTGDVLQIAQGSLYPALHRLEEEGWVEAEWGASEANRQAKFYELTRAGRKQLTAEEENWQRIADAVARVSRRPDDAAAHPAAPAVGAPPQPRRARARPGAAVPSRQAFGAVAGIKDDVLKIDGSRSLPAEAGSHS